MSSTVWDTLSDFEPARLGEVRLQAHYAVQWLARAARAFVPARDDDSHTNLGWDDALSGFATHPLPHGARLALRVPDLTVLLLASDGNREFVLDGHADAEVRKWLAHELGAVGCDAGRLDDPLPYALPAHAIAHASYATGEIGEALAALAAWYANANRMLGLARERIVAHGLAAPPVRCWPHHFDLDTLVTFGSTSTMGIGFSPGDEYYGEPYFYVSLYPEPDVASLPALPPVGHWHTHEFTAAIATASRIVAVRDGQAETDAFLACASEFGIRVLS